MTPEEKAKFVREMFDDIAPRYDLLNSLLSVGIHKGWRTFATRCACLSPGDSVLGVCSGTGDWTDHLRRVVGPNGTVAVVDFSLPMLRYGAVRFARNGVGDVQGDATRLPFAANAFDAATVAYGFGTGTVGGSDVRSRVRAYWRQARRADALERTILWVPV